MSKLFWGKDERNRDVIYARHCKISGGPYNNFSGREVKDRNDGRIFNKEGDRNFVFEIDNEDDIELLRNESVNVKLVVNDISDDEDGITNARVRCKLKVKTDEQTGKQSPEIFLRTGIKDENGEYVNKFKRFNLKFISELDKYMYDDASFMFGVSRKNPTHALYLNQAYLTIAYAPNPLELEYAGQIEEEGADDFSLAALDPASNDEEELPF